jgi:hypothetical protein
MGRWLAVIVAAGYTAALAVVEGGVTVGVLKLGIGLLFPLALIWFAESLAEFTGSVGRGGVVEGRSPSVLVAAVGWFFLVGVPVLVVLFK